MSRAEKIRLIYAVFLGVFAVAVGIAVICVAADIYYGGKAAGGQIYTREIVGERLTALAIPLILLIVAIIAGAVFPLYQTRVKPKSEDAVAALLRKKPTGAADGNAEEFGAALAEYKKASVVRLVAWLTALAVALASAIVVLCYLLRTSNFSGEDVTEEIFAMTKNILPYIGAAFLVAIAAAVVNGIFSGRELKALKTMIKLGDGAVSQPNGKVAAVKNVAQSRVTLWVVRGVILVVAVVFIIVGALNGGAHDVLVKAVNICQECIGLG